MRAPSLALAALSFLLLAGPAVAIDLVELKDGRVYATESVEVRGDRLLLDLHIPEGDRRISFTVPVEKVVPEFVYYAWAQQLDPADVDGRTALAAWARAHGLFRQAWRQYEEAATYSEDLRASLPGLRTTLHEEEATWIYEQAERLFRDDEVKAVRVHLERLLASFGDTPETARAQALLGILAEREQFLTEQRRQAEIMQRARKQQREVDKHLERIDRADRLVFRARMSYSADAKRRFTYAAYAYREAILFFEELLPMVEVDELRRTLEGLLDTLPPRLARIFLKLADLRFLTGDMPSALDAVHEVLLLDPGSAAAADLRARILDGPPAPVEVCNPYGYVYHRRMSRFLHGLPAHRSVDVRFGGGRSTHAYPVRELEPAPDLSRPHKTVDLFFGGHRTVYRYPVREFVPTRER